MDYSHCGKLHVKIFKRSYSAKLHVFITSVWVENYSVISVSIQGPVREKRLTYMWLINNHSRHISRLFIKYFGAIGFKLLLFQTSVSFSKFFRPRGPLVFFTFTYTSPFSEPQQPIHFLRDAPLYFSTTIQTFRSTPIPLTNRSPSPHHMVSFIVHP